MSSFLPNRNSGESSGFEVLLNQTLHATNPSLHECVYEAFHAIDASVKRGEMSWTNPMLSTQNLQNMAYNLFVNKQKSSSSSSLPGSASLSSGLASRMHFSSAEYGFPHQDCSRKTDSLNTNVSASLPGASAQRNRKRPLSCTYFFNPEDQQRFQLFAKGKCDEDSGSAHRHPLSFKGCSSELERKYSRDAPTPEDIRPEPVLVEALSYITAQAAQKEKAEGRRVAVQYMSEQLKGIRQDLRVQDIRNNFAVKVYEMHARLSLECEDLGEFNQCQAALKHLYLLPTIDRSACSIAEFFCYRLVYLSLGEQFDSLSTELVHYTNLYLKRKEVKSIVHYIPRKWVQRALQIAVACDSGDTLTLASILDMFSLEMHYLLRIFLFKRRVRWLSTLLTGVKGSVPLLTVLAGLGFLPIKQSNQGTEKPRLLWLDLSIKEAEKRIQQFFETIKLELPQGFTLSKIIKEEEEGTTSQWTLQGEHAKSAVDLYVAYLTTRRDAAGSSDDV